jgi:HEAT repeat protein
MEDRKPNIKALVSREDIGGLVKAASYGDSTPGSAGTASDFGVSVRADAILALGALAPQAGYRAVVAGLRDPADHVRCAAVRVLHSLNEISLLTEALGWLPADEGDSRRLALQAITDRGKSVSVAAVANVLVHREDEELLGEEDAQLILALLEAEAPEATDELIGSLIRALGDARGIVADRAAEMLARLAPESTEALVAELRGGPAAADAAYVLGRIADPQTADPLVKALRHRDTSVRAESAAALGELRDPAAVKPLLRASRDKEHTVRTQAALALDRLGTAAVIVGVTTLLEPIIHKAVRSAMDRAKLEPEGEDRLLPAARRQSRSRQSNGGPPEAADPQPTEEQDTR